MGHTGSWFGYAPGSKPLIIVVYERGGRLATIEANDGEYVLRYNDSTAEVTEHSRQRTLNAAIAQAEQSYGIPPRGWTWPCRAVFDRVASALERDLGRRFASVKVRFLREDDAWECEVVEGVRSWGSVGVWPDDDDALTGGEVEQFTADLVQQITDSLWPDDATDPWPPCPEHHDHPLQIAVRRGRASWVCLLDSSVAIPIGEWSDQT